MVFRRGEACLAPTEGRFIRDIRKRIGWAKARTPCPRGTARQAILPTLHASRMVHAMNESSPQKTSTENTPEIGAPQELSDRIGVLLVNLGTPHAADAAGVRRYLQEFLSHPRGIHNPE